MRIPLEIVLSFALGLLLLYGIGWLLLIPMRFLWRLVAGGILGGFALFLVNQFGSNIGLSVAINPITALIVGFLGIPGVALVIGLQFLL